MFAEKFQFVLKPRGGGCYSNEIFIIIKKKEKNFNEHQAIRVK